MALCTLCPRLCSVDRSAGKLGFCGQSNNIKICRAAPHMFEEPPISGKNGSGTVFFAGCSLRCVFCQNRDISRSSHAGREVSVEELAQIFLELQESGVHNINLVTATHFADGVAKALEIARHDLKIPVVYNTSGYERVETLKMLEGLIDIYLPDFKYATPALAMKYSSAPDYPEVAALALIEMFRQVGKYEFFADGMLKKGLVVRHLVLPSARKESMSVLDRLASILPTEDILLSLMSQYTPEFAKDYEFTELHRRVTTFEYESVLNYASKLGFDGFMQSRTSATSAYTPEF